MVEEAVDKASDFYMDLFTLEWQKMVLPLLMVLILSASALSTMDLKNSDESRQITELSLETMANVTEVQLRTEYFNDSINESRRALSDEIMTRAGERKDELTSGMFTEKAFIGSLQRLSFFPYTPEFDVPLPVSERDYLTSLALVSYRQSQFNSLGERLNSSENISMMEFEDEMDRIKSVDWRSEEVKAYLRNYSEPEGSPSIGSTGLTEELRQKVIDEDFDELSFTAYLPSLIATFLIYYVVNAVAVQSGRKAYGQIKASRRQKEDPDEEDAEDRDTEEDASNRESSEDEGKDPEEEEDTGEDENTEKDKEDKEGRE